MKTCFDCNFAVLQDYGYSNYTVEGTTFRCAKKAHPQGECEHTFDDDPWATFADKCDSFESGCCIRLDVEGEQETLLSDEEKAIMELLRKDRP